MRRRFPGRGTARAEEDGPGRGTARTSGERPTGPGRPRTGAVRLAVALVAVLALPASGAPLTARAAAPTAGAALDGPPAPESGARCDLVRQAGEAVAVCLNPDPVTTRLQLHVTCARWWDPATDSAPVDDGPAQWVRLSGHCWKEMRSAWLTRRPVP